MICAVTSAVERLCSSLSFFFKRTVCTDCLKSELPASNQNEGESDQVNVLLISACRAFVVSQLCYCRGVFHQLNLNLRDSTLLEVSIGTVCQSVWFLSGSLHSKGMCV